MRVNRHAHDYGPNIGHRERSLEEPLDCDGCVNPHVPHVCQSKKASGASSVAMQSLLYLSVPNTTSANIREERERAVPAANNVWIRVVQEKRFNARYICSKYCQV